MAEEQKIMVKAIVEVLGSPKEHVEDTMKSVAEKIKDVFGLRLLTLHYLLKIC